MLTVGDLFSGIGGFSLGLERAGMRTAWFAEVDPYASAVLRKHWPDVPNHGDVRTIRAGAVERVDVLCGGFPCQPYSVAGKRAGATDDRALWPEYRRLIAELRPTWVIGENVIGLASMGLDEVLSDLEAAGYAWRAFGIPACAVGADHIRDRIFILAHANGPRSQERFLRPGVPRDAGRDDYRKDAALGIARETQPRLVRGVHGVPRRVDRVRCLGNAVVSQIPEIIGRAIIEAEGRR